jgi:hypothetical protein
MAPTCAPDDSRALCEPVYPARGRSLRSAWSPRARPAPTCAPDDSLALCEPGYPARGRSLAGELLRSLRSASSPRARLERVFFDHLEDVFALDLGPVDFENVLLYLGDERVDVVVANGDTAVALDELRHGCLSFDGVQYRALLLLETAVSWLRAKGELVSESFPHTFAPIALGPAAAPKRLHVTPHFPGLSMPDPTAPGFFGPAPDAKDYYVERARGGVGLIIQGGTIAVGARLVCDEMLPGGLGPTEMTEIAQRFDESGSSTSSTSTWAPTTRST